MQSTTLPVSPPRGALRAGCLAVLGLVLVAAVLLVGFVGWLLIAPTDALAGWLQALRLDGLPVDGTLRWRALAALLLPMAAAAAALWQLERLFRLLLAGRALTPAAQRRLQGFAAATTALGLLSPLAGALLSLLLTLDGPPGGRRLVITISSDQYLVVLLGAVLLVLARVMADAVRAAEENAGFV